MAKKNSDTKGQIAEMISNLAPPPKAQALPANKQHVPTPVAPAPVVPDAPVAPSGPNAPLTPEQMQARAPEAPTPVMAPVTPTVDPAMQAILTQMQTQQATIAAMQAQLAQPQEPQVASVALPPVESLLTPEEMSGMFNQDGTIDSAKAYVALTSMGQRAYQLAREDNLKEMPAIVAQTAKRETAIASTISSFWQNNQDLSAVRQQVAYEADAIVAANPHLTLDVVLTQASQKVRTALGAYSQAVDVQNNPQNNAAFVPVNSGGQRVDGADNRSSLQQGIDAMLNAS